MRAGLVVLLALLLFGVAAADGEPRSDTVSYYARPDWHFDSEEARRALRCGAGFEVDHIVPLHGAYLYGGDAWSDVERREFARDRSNQWCVPRALNRSKSDSTLAEWNGGSCDERKVIAWATWPIKRTYGLAWGANEEAAILDAIRKTCPNIASPFWCPDAQFSIPLPTQEQRSWAIARCAGAGN